MGTVEADKDIDIEMDVGKDDDDGVRVGFVLASVKVSPTLLVSFAAL